MRRALLLVILIPALSRAQAPGKTGFDTLAKSMDTAPPEQRLAFNALTVTYATFLDAHLRHEVCHAAAGCVAQRATEKTRLDNEFRFTASGFASAVPPNFNADDLAASDTALNGAYAKILGALPAACPASAPESECLSQATFKEVQRDWIRYRDAFVMFGTLRYPTISSDSWLTYLTRQRSSQLESAFHSR